MGYKITLQNGAPVASYDRDATIGTDLLLSALVPQGAFFLDPGFGLRAMPKKLTDQGLGLVQDYFKESSNWLLKANRAKTIDILVERDSELGRVNVRQTATQADDTVVTFETFVPLV